MEEKVERAPLLGISIHSVAQIAYGHVRAYSQTLGEAPMPNFWELPQIQQDFWKLMVTAAQGILPEYTHFDTMVCAAHMLHTRFLEWVNHNGWRSGNIVNWDTFEHKNVRPWDDLPVEERHKYGYFLASCKESITDSEEYLTPDALVLPGITEPDPLDTMEFFPEALPTEPVDFAGVDVDPEDAAEEPVVETPKKRKGKK